MRLLITGGTGLIGRALLAELADRHELFVLARRPSGGPMGTRWIPHDLARPLDLEALPATVDGIVHLAQASDTGPGADPSDVFAIGVDATFRLLHYARRAGAKKFVFASSGGVETLHPPSAGREARISVQPTIQFHLRAKACAELLAGGFAREMDVVVLRPFFVYGPGQGLPRLLPRLIAKIRAGEAIVTDSRGGPEINPTFVTDAARAFAGAVDRETPGFSILDVAGSEVTSVTQISKTLGSLLGREPVIIADGSRSPESLIGDVRAMRDALGIVPSVSLTEGLTRMLTPQEASAMEAASGGRGLVAPHGSVRHGTTDPDRGASRSSAGRPAGEAEVPIPITRPLFGAEEEAALIGVLRSGWVAQGPKVAEFEEAFARYVGVRFAIATTSCTTALHLALVALGIGPGDEVIVPAFTWISTANAVEYVGATPVFADIELETFNLDPASAEAKITARTRAIMPVHLFGLSADMDPILALARRHHLKVVEDAACGLGARYRGHHVGTFGGVGCFSFHPRKSITTGEGGMITTDDAHLAQLARSLRDHGASRSDLARHAGGRAYLLAEYPHLGFNYRMTDLQAAVGCMQMARVEGILATRLRLARAYDEALAGLPWLRPPAAPTGCDHGYQAYVCLFRAEPPDLGNVEALHGQRNALMDRLEAQGIATRQGTHAAALTAYYAKRYGLQPSDVPRSALAEKLSLTLPLYAQMTEEEQARVVAALRQA